MKASLRMIEKALYVASHNNDMFEEYVEIWDSIKNNKKLLNDASEIIEADNKKTMKSAVICNAVLTNFKDVDQDIYKNLVKKVYSDVEIARIVVDGAYNGGDSFLLKTLRNHDLVLTEEQKEFVLSEAKKKIGTLSYIDEYEKFSKALDRMGVESDTLTSLNINGEVYMINPKDKQLYFYYFNCAMSSSQAHGANIYDIRYEILRNPNWTEEEKGLLVYEFWANEYEYDLYLEAWEVGACVELQWEYDTDNEEEYTNLFLKVDELYDYTHEDIKNFFEDDKEAAEDTWDEIQFCRLMHKLRPHQDDLVDAKIRNRHLS